METIAINYTDGVMEKYVAINGEITIIREINFNIE